MSEIYRERQTVEETLFGPEFLAQYITNAKVRMVVDGLNHGATPYQFIEFLVKENAEIFEMMKQVIEHSPVPLITFMPDRLRNTEGWVKEK